MPREQEDRIVQRYCECGKLIWEGNELELRHLIIYTCGEHE